MLIHMKASIISILCASIFCVSQFATSASENNGLILADIDGALEMEGLVSEELEGGKLNKTEFAFFEKLEELFKKNDITGFIDIIFPDIRPVVQEEMEGMQETLKIWSKYKLFDVIRKKTYVDDDYNKLQFDIFNEIGIKLPDNASVTRWGIYFTHSDTNEPAELLPIYTITTEDGQMYLIPM